MFLRLSKSIKISFHSAAFRSFGKKGKPGKETKAGKEERGPAFEFDLDKVTKDMESVVKIFDSSLQKVTIGRGDPRVFDKIYVPTKQTELSQLAQIVPKNANEVLIKPFDVKNLEDILAALNGSELQFQYRKEANSSIHVNIPKPTQEYRSQLIKQAREYLEESKQNIRKKRQSSLNSLKDAKDVGEDDLKQIKNDIQKITDKYTEVIEKMMKDKEKSLNN